MLNISVKDQASSYLGQSGPRVRNAMRYALASCGKYLRNEIKIEGKVGSRGGYLGWPPLNPFTGVINRTRDRWGRRRGIRVHRGRGKNKFRYGSRKKGGGFNLTQISTRTEPLSRMINAVTSKIDTTGGSVRIGFLRPTLWQAMTRQADGFSIRVTPRMRKMLFAIGVPIGALPELHIPARKWIETVYEHEKDTVTARFGEKFKAKFENQGL